MGRICWVPHSIRSVLNDAGTINRGAFLLNEFALLFWLIPLIQSSSLACFLTQAPFPRHQPAEVLLSLSIYCITWDIKIHQDKNCHSLLLLMATNADSVFAWQCCQATRRRQAASPSGTAQVRAARKCISAQGREDPPQGGDSKCSFLWFLLQEDSWRLSHASWNSFSIAMGLSALLAGMLRGKRGEARASQSKQTLWSAMR